MTLRSRRPASRKGIRPQTRSTRRGAPAPTSRTRMPSAKKNNTPLIVGLCCGGGFLLIVLIAVAATSGGTDRTRPGKAPESNRPEPVDVQGYEREGERLCGEGLGIVQGARDEMSRSLSAAEQRALKTKLLKAKEFLTKGLGYFEKAMDASGKKYDVTRYQEAYKMIRMKIPELAD